MSLTVLLIVQLVKLQSSSPIIFLYIFAYFCRFNSIIFVGQAARDSSHLLLAISGQQQTYLQSMRQYDSKARE